MRYKDGLPTYTYLFECFDYDPLTGILTWKDRPREHFKSTAGWKIFSGRDAGKPAGHPDGQGYLAAKVDGRNYKCHRIAWALTNQIDLADVPAEIDHRNLVKTDNCKDNLRPATGSENCCNKANRSDNSSGHKGVDFHTGSGRWRARIMVRGKSQFLGWFDTIDDAVKARADAQHLHGEFARLANDNKTTEVAA